jgi:tRNA threonylcarbamoyladenosine biosynthesis protein TsaE
VVSLTGPLGAGKTVLVKGIAAGCGINDTVTSPSYTIISEYDGTIPLTHIDLYRLENEEEVELLGLEEILAGEGISVLEWGERAEHLLPEDCLHITITIENDGRRIFTITGAQGKDFAT